MASIVIRDLEEHIKARLRVVAAQHGRSMEAEARAILTAAVGAERPEYGLGTFIHERIADTAGVDIVVPPRKDLARLTTLGD